MPPKAGDFLSSHLAPQEDTREENQEDNVEIPDSKEGFGRFRVGQKNTKQGQGLE